MPAFMAGAWARTFCKDSKNKNKNRVCIDKNKQGCPLAAIMEQCVFCVLQAFVSFIPLNNGETFLNKV